MGKKCDLKNPKSFNEKIQWLKLNTYYNNPLITQCIDKYKVRNYIEDKGLAFILPDLYGVFDLPEEIHWDLLPASYVIKCNHGCGYNILCPNASQLNIQDSIRNLNSWLKEAYWTTFGEVQYKFIEKRIIIEEYLGEDLETYKFYCFNGKPKVFYISTAGEQGQKDFYIDFFNMDWDNQDIHFKRHPSHPYRLIKPDNFNEMVEIAEVLSKEFPFVRVDLYSVRGKSYFSELTFVPTGGFMNLEPQEILQVWGRWLDLDYKR